MTDVPTQWDTVTRAWSRRRNTLNTSDGIYLGGGTQLLMPMTTSGGGYNGSLFVGVRV